MKVYAVKNKRSFVYGDKSKGFRRSSVINGSCIHTSLDSAKMFGDNAVSSGFIDGYRIIEGLLYFEGEVRFDFE